MIINISPELCGTMLHFSQCSTMDLLYTQKTKNNPNISPLNLEISKRRGRLIPEIVMLTYAYVSEFITRRLSSQDILYWMLGVFY